MMCKKMLPKEKNVLNCFITLDDWENGAHDAVSPSRSQKDQDVFKLVIHLSGENMKTLNEHCIKSKLKPGTFVRETILSAIKAAN